MKKMLISIFVVTTFINSLSCSNIQAYESVHNQSLGKMEMLEVIDKHIKNSITRDINYLKKEIKKLKEKKTVNKFESKKKDTELYTLTGEVSENRQSIRDLDRRVSRLSTKLSRIEALLKQLTIKAESGATNE